MKQIQTFVDIHCHLLPGIDDGARDWDEALAMAEMAVADGITTIITTPHQLGSHAKNAGDMIRTATARFQESLDRRRIPLCVLPGADVRIEPSLVQKIRAGEVVTLADRGRHVLLELPHQVYLPLERLLSELSAAGMVGVLSHPERNQGILQQPGLVRKLVERGCLMQITAGSLLGSFGASIQRFTESLIEQGLVHFVSTDAHGLKTRKPLLQQAFQRTTELVGETFAVDLFFRHPDAIARGRNVPGGSRKSAKSSWTAWLPWISTAEAAHVGTT